MIMAPMGRKGYIKVLSNIMCLIVGERLKWHNGDTCLSAWGESAILREPLHLVAFSSFT
jgi:hypothetical protein